MAATSPTRRRGRPRTTNRTNNRSTASEFVTIEVSRPFASALNDARQAIGRMFSALAANATAAPLRAAESVRETIGSAVTTAPSAPRQQRRRARPRSTERTPTQRTTGNRRTEIIDAVRRNLPAVGGSTSVRTLADAVSRDLNRNVRPQDIGQALNKLPNGTVNRIGRDIVETRRAA